MVEFADIDKVQGFVRAHDDLFQKQVITPGSRPYFMPVDNCECVFTCELVDTAENFPAISFPESPIRIGFHSTFPSYVISRALQTMTLDEKSRYNIQMDGQVVTFDLLLVNFEEKNEIYIWEREERLDMCYKLKSLATELFKRSEYFWAHHNYHRSLIFLCLSDEKDDSLTETKAQLISNIALCQSNFNIKEVEKPIQNLSKVLEIEPNNVKALFRRGKLYLSVNKFELAENDLEKAFALDPANQAVLEQRKQLKKKRQEHDDVTATAMAKFFLNSM